MRKVMRNRVKLGEQKNIIKEDMSKRRKMVEDIVTKWSEQKDYPRLTKNWSKLSDKEQEKTAIYLENQKNHLDALKQLSETAISSAFTLTPEKVLEVVRLFAPNSNLGNIFREIPMLSTDDAFYYVDAVYDGTPSRSPSVDGNKYYEQIDQYFASEKQLETAGTGDGSTVTFNKTLTTKPVRPGSCILVIGGKYRGVDDGSGAFESSLLSSSSINYTTGAVSLTFSSAPADADVIQIEYNWDSEEVTNYDELGEVKLAIRKNKLEAKIQPLGFSYSKLAELVLSTTGLGDAKEILTRAVGEELMKARDYRAVWLAKRVAKSNTEVTFDTNFANAGADSEWEHAQIVSAYVDKMGNDIYNDIKRGAISKIIAGPGACTYLKFHKTWVDDNSQPRIGLHLIGRFNGIEVYKCPADTMFVANNEIIGVYKNENNEGDCSIVFGTLIPMFDAGVLNYPQQFKTEGALAHFGDEVVVEEKYIRMLTLDGLQF